jgi:hypothetical protein
MSPSSLGQPVAWCDARYLPSRKAVFDPLADAQAAYIGLK